MDNQNNKNNKNNKQGISFILLGYYIDPGDRTVPVSGNDLCKKRLPIINF